MGSIKDFIWDLFPHFYKKFDTYKNSSGEGFLERYIKAFGYEIDEKLMPYLKEGENDWRKFTEFELSVSSDFRLPTRDEWETERLSWSSNDFSGAFGSVLKLPLAGNRNTSGTLLSIGTVGNYWSSTVLGQYSNFIQIFSVASLESGPRAIGRSVRLIKDGIYTIETYQPQTIKINGLNYNTVFNPITGRVWLDRNLGSTQVAESPTDESAYGWLYQWGRGSDGHQIRTSSTTLTLSDSDTPGHGDFILSPIYPDDWRSPQNNDLWQGVNGVNNPGILIQLQTISKYFLNNIEALKTEVNLLKHLVDSLGNPPEFLDDENQRKLLQYIVYLYKIKGTKLAYEFFINLLGFDVEIYEYPPGYGGLETGDHVRYDLDPPLLYDEFLYDSNIGDTGSVCITCSEYDLLLSSTENELNNEIIDILKRVIYFIEPINAILKHITLLIEPFTDTTEFNINETTEVSIITPYKYDMDPVLLYDDGWNYDDPDVITNYNI